MKSKASKRILSLFLALMVTIAPLTFGMAAEITEPEAPGNAGIQVFRMEDLQEVERTARVTVDGQDFRLSDADESFVRDVPELDADLPSLVQESAVQKKSLKAVATTYNQDETVSLTSNPTYIDTANYYVAYSGTYCNVLVSQNTGVDSAFYAAEAANIGQEFDNDIYSKATALIGAPNFVNLPFTALINLTGSKTNIVLANIKNPGILGFVTAGDFYDKSNYGLSNQGAFVYINVQANSIHDRWYRETTGLGDQIRFMATISHEYQHLVNNTYLFSHGSWDPDLSFDRAVWLNEGISGLVETDYMGLMEPGYVEDYVSNDFSSPSVSYVTTDDDWDGRGSLYGVSAILMLEYKAMGGDVPPLVQSNKVGYANSLSEVGVHSGKSDFNAFFREAVLATAISNPTGTWASASGYNLWQARQDVGGASGFSGVEIMNPAGNTVNSGGRAYYSQLFLSDAIGADNNAVDITVPASATTDYMVIYPVAGQTASTADQWVAATRDHKILNAGVNQIEIGNNNRFAVVAINYGSSVSGESFSYAATKTKGVFLDSVVTDPARGLMAHTPVQKVTLNVNTLDIPDGTTLPVKVVDIDGADVMPFTQQAAMVVTANKASVTFDISDEVVAGIFKFKVTSPDDDVVLGEFAVTAKGELVDPGADPALIKNIEVSFFEATVKAGTGKFVITDADATNYYASAPNAELAATVSIPLSSFRDANGKYIILDYSKTYTVSMEDAAILDSLDNPNLSQVIGTFTTQAEGADPVVLPDEIEIAKNSIGEIRVLFGTSGEYEEATITSSNDNVEIIDADIAAPGGIVTFRAAKLGDAIISIGYSGPGVDEENPLSTTREVKVKVTGQPDVPVPDDGFFGNGGSSSGGGGGGGGGGIVGIIGPTAIKPVDVTTTAANNAAKSAAAAAKAAGSATATATLKNPGNISLEALKAMTKTAGMPMLLRADSMTANGKAVDVRITLDPSKATKAMNLSGSTYSDKAKATKAFFQKYYSNKIAVISLGQKDNFGMKVEIAAKVDLTGMDVNKLVLYSYNKEKNQYVRISNANYWIDKNGYLHFTTELAGDIIISEGTLLKK